MLRRVNMRTFSSPLDWMFRYDLSLYSDLLHKREFDLFREYEENEESPSEHRNVRDLRTGMISLHHFTKNQSIQEQLPDFHATMNKRLQRLISEIQQSKDVGIVMNRDIPAEEIKEFIDSLSRLSPSCAFHVLNVRHSETQSRVTWKKYQERAGIPYGRSGSMIPIQPETWKTGMPSGGWAITAFGKKC